MPTVYLLHFHMPYKNAGHYLGVTEMAWDARIAAHRAGERTIPLLRALLVSGGDFLLADVWEAATMPEAVQLVQRLRKQGSRARICSLCNPGNYRGVGRGNWPRLRGESQGVDPPTPDMGGK